MSQDQLLGGGKTCLNDVNTYKWDMRRLNVMTGLPPSVLLKIYDLIFKFRNKSSILDLLFLTVPKATTPYLY